MNRGFMMLMKELPRERLLIAVQAAATMEAAFEFTRDYVKERKAFGKTIVSSRSPKVSIFFAVDCLHEKGEPEYLY